MATVSNVDKRALSADDIEVRAAVVARRALRRDCSNSEIRASVEAYLRCMTIANGALPAIDIDRAIAIGCRKRRALGPVPKRQEMLDLRVAS